MGSFQKKSIKKNTRRKLNKFNIETNRYLNVLLIRLCTNLRDNTMVPFRRQRQSTVSLDIVDVERKHGNISKKNSPILFRRQLVIRLERMLIDMGNDQLISSKNRNLNNFPLLENKLVPSVYFKDDTNFYSLHSISTIARPITRSIKHSITPSITPSITRPIIHPITRSITHSITPLITRPITRSITRSETSSTTRSVTRSVTPSITRSVTLSITRPITRSITRSITRTITRSTTRSVSPLSIPTQSSFSSQNLLLSLTSSPLQSFQFRGFSNVTNHHLTVLLNRLFTNLRDNTMVPFRRQRQSTVSLDIVDVDRKRGNISNNISPILFQRQLVIKLIKMFTDLPNNKLVPFVQSTRDNVYSLQATSSITRRITRSITRSFSSSLSITTSTPLEIQTEIITPPLPPHVILSQLLPSQTLSLPQSPSQLPPLPPPPPPIVESPPPRRFITNPVNNNNNNDNNNARNRRRRHAEIPRRVTHRLAISITVENLELLADNAFNVGNLTDLCAHCGALFFTKEFKNRLNVRLICCQDGAFSLPPLSQWSNEIKNLYLDDANFRREIRSINSMFAMASFKTSQPTVDRRGGGQGHWCFSVSGQIYHMLGGIPNENHLRNPVLNHYYFLDIEDALEKRNVVLENRVSPEILEIIERSLRRENRYIRAYKTVAEMLQEERVRLNLEPNETIDNIVVGFVSHGNINRSRRNLDLPDSRSEIAAIFPGNELPERMDLILYPHNPNASQAHMRHHELKNLSPLADPFVYPLLFPRGDNGYSIDLNYTDRRMNRNNRVKTVTMNEFYKYRLQIKRGYSTLHNGGKLFQQYIVDSWCKIEANKLWYLKQNQEKFRVASETALRRINANRQQLRQNTDVTNDMSHIGKSIIILPSSFQGGERNLQRRYLDAMTIIAKHGKPDLFITMTCNPKWPEIQTNLRERQKWDNRPDLVCRVFHTKLLELMDDLVNKQILGVVKNYHYVIEFQKRGLPHAHIVLTMYHMDKILDVDAVDRIISAQIPNPEIQPFLYNLVKEFHVHAPCGKKFPDAVCMRNGKCKKFYPKSFKEYTSLYIGDNKRPEYKRPVDNRTIYLESHHSSVDNRRIVPFNSYLLSKFQCHINVEAVGSLYTMKYLHKYIEKGSDSITLRVNNPERQQPPTANENDHNQNNINNSATVVVNNAAAVPPSETFVIDEIKQYQEFRYVGAMEAYWRIANFLMHDRSHSVLVLPVHLPNERQILYDELDDADNIQQRLESRSKLESWFKLNRESAEARQFLYSEIPEHYTWENKDATWQPRKKISKQVGCMIDIVPSILQMDYFFVRLLLTVVNGATSFEDLRKGINGEVYPTFLEACRARNLISDRQEFERAMREAALKRHPRKLRIFFALYCCVTFDEGFANFNDIWRLFYKQLMDDYVVVDRLSLKRAEIKAVRFIDEIISRNRPGYSLSMFGVKFIHSTDNDDIINERYNDDNYDDDDNDDDDDLNERRNIYNDERYDEDLPFNLRKNPINDNNENVHIDAEYDPIKLNPDQKRIFLKIFKIIAHNINVALPPNLLLKLGDVVSIEDIQDPIDINQTIFYVDGPGGTGKTFLYNSLIWSVNHYFQKETIAVAWTGIAATLLIGGKTVHRTFRLPMHLTESTVSGWSIDSNESQNILNNVSLIIWDEAPMTPKLAVEVVDRYLRDLTKRPVPMGGFCCLFGGDFRQILPIVIGGHKRDVINACLKSSFLWQSLGIFHLNFNMRAKNDTNKYTNLNDKIYSQWLLDLGDGLLPYVTLHQKSTISGVFPKDLIEIPSMFCVSTLTSLIQFVYENDFTGTVNSSRAILCPTNVAVEQINNLILDKMEDIITKTYISVDSYSKGTDDDFHVPVDLLNSINSPSLAPHILTLKVGAIVMLLRNIDLEMGLCNGTRLRIVSLGEHIIESELLSGINMGRKIILTKIKMYARDTMLPKEMIRLQFPIRLAYGITINKSQGQSLSRAGIYLPNPCFAHGQLYVAFSRVGDANNIRIFMAENDNHGSFKFRGRRFFTRNPVYFDILDSNNSLLNLNNNNNKNNSNENRILIDLDLVSNCDNFNDDENHNDNNINNNNINNFMVDDDDNLINNHFDPVDSDNDSNFDILNDLNSFSQDQLFLNIDLDNLPIDDYSPSYVVSSTSVIKKPTTTITTTTITSVTPSTIITRSKNKNINIISDIRIDNNNKFSSTTKTTTTTSHLTSPKILPGNGKKPETNSSFQLKSLTSAVVDKKGKGKQKMPLINLPPPAQEPTKKVISIRLESGEIFKTDNLKLQKKIHEAGNDLNKVSNLIKGFILKQQLKEGRRNRFIPIKSKIEIFKNISTINKEGTAGLCKTYYSSSDSSSDSD